MKKAFLTFTVIIMLVGLLTSSANAATIIDDFNDGNADGWVSYPSLKEPWVYGNWRVESGVLINDMGGDGFIAFLDNYYLSDQNVETQFKFIGPAGYCGFMIWFQDNINFIFVSAYPPAGGIGVAQWVDGVEIGTLYPYYMNYNDNLWYNLKVEADSVSGDISVYVDGDYFFTHHTTTPKRTGRTGLATGNSGCYFDDFKLDSNDLPPTIDIKPGDAYNTINLKGVKNISVAMLSSTNFSAPDQIDRTTITFGKTGDENSLISCAKRSKDVNGDGLLDLVCTFSVKSTGFQCGDTEGILKGKVNITGMTFMDKQGIMFEPCK